MPIFISQGRYTREAIAGMIASPEDRAAAARKLVEAAGGKLLASYFTFGEFDFMVITEAPDLKAITPALIAAAAAGGITDMKTTVGLSWDDARQAFGDASALRASFRAAGTK